ncbi:MAG: RES family NAD+ phosphorylase [Chloroflexota bacterium]|nr:RES family NAD+ phosphorylase [Chloroflexota bacterium]
MSPNQLPPPRYTGRPARFLLPAGTTLTRVHSTAFGVTQFNPTLALDDLQGGRFDGTPEDEYAFLYTAEDDATAISEALLRDLPADEYGARLLPRTRLSQVSISWLRVTTDLELVSLRSGHDLAAVGQDTWLTASPAAEYASTRQWASAIRGWAPWACGLTWRSFREPEGFAYVFFADRCPEGCLEEVTDGLPVPPGGQGLDTGAAWLYIEGILASYRVALM